MTAPKEFKQTAYNHSQCLGGCGKYTQNRLQLCPSCRTRECVKCGKRFKAHMVMKSVCVQCTNKNRTTAHKYAINQGD